MSGIRKKLATAIKNPSRIPKYLWWRSGLDGVFNKNVRKRVPFSYEMVVSGYGKEGAGLPSFSSRLYREVKLLQQAIGDYKAEKSLEIGCGYGRLTPWIMEYSSEHYAVEPEKRLFEDAKRLNPQKAYFHNVTAQKLPFPDSFFELCVSWTVLQHIPPKEQTKAIEEIKRVAKKTAVLIVAEDTGTYEEENKWMRSMENWAELFKPWQLVWQTDRILEETASNPQGKVMRFEQR
jgi:SAM-dependent methyltransferase